MVKKILYSFSTPLAHRWLNGEQWWWRAVSIFQSELTEDPRAKQGKGRGKRDLRRTGEKRDRGEVKRAAHSPTSSASQSPGVPSYSRVYCQLYCVYIVPQVYLSYWVYFVVDLMYQTSSCIRCICVSVCVGRQYVSVSQNMEGPRTTLPAWGGISGSPFVWNSN